MVLRLRKELTILGGFRLQALTEHYKIKLLIQSERERSDLEDRVEFGNWEYTSNFLINYGRPDFALDSVSKTSPCHLWSPQLLSPQLQNDNLYILHGWSSQFGYTQLNSWDFCRCNPSSSSIAEKGTAFYLCFQFYFLMAIAL